MGSSAVIQGVVTRNCARPTRMTTTNKIPAIRQCRAAAHDIVVSRPQVPLTSWLRDNSTRWGWRAVCKERVDRIRCGGLSLPIAYERGYTAETLVMLSTSAREQVLRASTERVRADPQSCSDTSLKTFSGLVMWARHSKRLLPMDGGVGLRMGLLV